MWKKKNLFFSSLVVFCSLFVSILLSPDSYAESQIYDLTSNAGTGFTTFPYSNFFNQYRVDTILNPDGVQYIKIDITGRCNAYSNKTDYPAFSLQNSDGINKFLFMVCSDTAHKNDTNFDVSKTFLIPFSYVESTDKFSFKGLVQPGATAGTPAYLNVASLKLDFTSDSFGSCPECPDCPPVPDYPYTNQLDSIKSAIYIVGASIVVLCFFKVIMNMYMGVRR